MSKILIVDDEVQIRTLLARMMELEGPMEMGWIWCCPSKRRLPMWKSFS